MKTLFTLCLMTILSVTAHLVTAQQIDYRFKDESLPIEERAEILVSQMTLEEKISQMTSEAAAIPRLDVPDYHWWSEALHGIARNGKATIFPQAIGMGATWDVDLISRVANAISDEARAKYDIAQKLGNHSKYAGLTFWSPTVNLFRDPRYGRGQECYGEDPYHMSKLAVAYVKGMQGDDDTYLKTAACAKHFVMHSGPEHGKLTFNVEAPIQDLYETYFPSFKALVVDAKVEGVMTAYNMVYGKPSVLSEFLVKETLRENWKFDGYITSDCGAINGAAGRQGYAKSGLEAAAMAANTGVNLNCGSAYKGLKKAVENGWVTEETIHDLVVQLYKTRFRLGMFNEPGTTPYENISPDVIHCDKHIALAREMAQKSIVLLKNKNNVLPLSPEVKVPFVTGPWANSNDVLMGSYYGVSTGLVSIMEGITDALAPGTSLNYRTGALPFQINPNEKNFAPFVVPQSDVTICVVGTTRYMEGESVDAIASDWNGDKKTLDLPENQIRYIKALAEKKGDKPLILIVATGGPVTLDEIEHECDAIIQMWYPGEQGGNAVADVLFGKISPSGKLPVTFPKSVNQLPAYEDYNMTGRTYKYMTKEPAYPFGYGLSYSKTEFSNLSVNNTRLKKTDQLDVTVEVSNIGQYDQDEVVQLYICPVNATGGIPLKSLKGFQRVSLAKGGKQTVSFTVAPEDLMIINELGQKEWRKGEYKIVVGNASPGDLSVKLGAAQPQETLLQLK